MSRQSDIALHYDLSNDFFKLWLDERMVYTCAYFPTGREDIHQAQLAKLDHLCKKLRLKSGDSLLDIGCGWGAMMFHAVEKYGVRAAGVTLSRNQYDYIQDHIRTRGLGDKCHVDFMDYIDLPATTRYNKIVSVGLLSHVGRGQVAHYLTKVKSLLSPHGLFLNHDISVTRKTGRPRKSAINRFMDDYIFPGAALVDIGYFLQELELHGFEVHDIEGLREHYARTLALWSKRFNANLPELTRMAGLNTVRACQIYLAGSQVAFEVGDLCLYQTLVSLRQHPTPPDLPPGRGDIYR